MSTEYFQLVGILFQRSSQIGAGERSLWVYAGLPLLVAGIEAFLIEHQRLFTSTRRSGPLAGIEPLMDVVKSYNLPIPLVQAIADLVEVRHEIIHPATPPFNCSTATRRKAERKCCRCSLRTGCLNGALTNAASCYTPLPPVTRSGLGCLQDWPTISERRWTYRAVLKRPCELPKWRLAKAAVTTRLRSAYLAVWGDTPSELSR